jgi:hypothetical protein
MPSTTEINVAAFDELQSQSFDESKKYLPLGEEVLEYHQFGSQIQGLIKCISNGEHNAQNIFNLEVSEGYPVAVYGFTVALNKSGVPYVLFGNSENSPNEFSIIPTIDEDDETVFKVGKAWVEFEQNPKTKLIETYVGFKKIRVKARGLFVENLNFNRLMSSNSIESLAECLVNIPSGGGYGYKLKDLCHPEVIEQKGQTFKLILNVDSIDELYQGDSFTSRNLNVSSVDGKPVWARDKDGNIGEVSKISIYNSMTAGSICEELGAARFILCKLYKGTTQLVLIRPNSNPEYNPSHVLQMLPPSTPELAEAYKKAKSELALLASEGKNFNHLLTPDSVKTFLNGGSTESKKELPPAKKAATVSVIEEEEEEDAEIAF